MRWFWVHFEHRADGYYTSQSWQLVAAENEQHIRDGFANTDMDVLTVIPYHPDIFIALREGLRILEYLTRERRNHD